MDNTSRIFISKSAYINNLNFIRSQLNQNVRISSVVKGNAYGHTVKLIVPLAQENGIDHFSVFSADEAYEVLKVIKKPADIMIMGWIDPHNLEWVIENEIEFFVFETSRLKEAASIVQKTGKKARIHIELETGMNRTGFNARELRKALDIIQKQPNYFEIMGLCTHYAGAESISNYVRVHNQIKNFKRFEKVLHKRGITPKIKHTACSAAAMSYPVTQMDMVRMGILQYGFWPSIETFIHYSKEHKTHENPLKRVIEWKSKVMSTKKVKTGEFVSYGTTYLAREDKKTAIIPVGYSNGYSRSLSNHSRVLINGQRVNVIGMVNMNMLIADITNIGRVNVGDEVVLIGKQGDVEISVASFSELSNMLNYELLTRIPTSVKRFLVS